jgi:hypothetical protein
MSDEREKKDDPKEELKQGLTHLWRAARGVAAEVKKEVDRTDLGKAIDGAGRDFVRAAANVVDRIAEEVDDLTKGNAGAKPGAPPPPVRDDAPPAADDEFDGVQPRARQADPTPAGEGGGARSPDEPGLRIAVEDEKKKPE